MDSVAGPAQVTALAPGHCCTCQLLQLSISLALLAQRRAKGQPALHPAVQASASYMGFRDLSSHMGLAGVKLRVRGKMSLYPEISSCLLTRAGYSAGHAAWLCQCRFGLCFIRAPSQSDGTRPTCLYIPFHKDTFQEESSLVHLRVLSFSRNL